MEAAKAGSVELVRAILRKGGNPNALDMNRFSAAHYAAMGNFLEVCHVLSTCLFSHCIVKKVQVKRDVVEDISSHFDLLLRIRILTMRSSLLPRLCYCSRLSQPTWV